MRTSFVTVRTFKHVNVRTWAWWELPLPVRCYVGAVPSVALVLTAITITQSQWRSADLRLFAVLLTYGLISVWATPRISYPPGVLVRDFVSAWVLPVAVFLPPVYALVAPIPLIILTQLRIYKGVIYRKVFTAAAMGLAYGAASLLFHAFPASLAGSDPGRGIHAVTWALIVILAELAGGRGHNALIAIAVKISNPNVRLVEQELSREALTGDVTEFNLGMLITVLIAVSPVYGVFGILTWAMVRRFMMHNLLLAKSRIDTKTGLLNASTWESEATTEIARCIRASTPISVALIDIDHFKLVNDTHGHLVGDKVLGAMGDEIRDHLRSTDIAGRFGGEEFVILLPNARETDAIGVAERLRGHVEDTPIPITEDDDSRCVKLTISIGVAALDDDCHELTDLLAAADAALYHAKETGRNKVHAVSATAHKQRFTVTAQTDPASALRCSHGFTSRVTVAVSSIQAPHHVEVAAGMNRHLDIRGRLRRERRSHADLGRRHPMCEALDTEPYCAACGATIEIFAGHNQQWRHFRGNVTSETE